MFGQKDVPKPSTDPARPKVITSELREEYFQARGDLFAAQAQIADAQKRVDAAVEKMKSACGADPVVIDQKGKPQCGKAEAPPPK